MQVLPLYIWACEELKHAEPPGEKYPQTDAYAPQARMFMSFYFMMTGVHATHMIVGEGIFLWLLITVSPRAKVSVCTRPAEVGAD